MLRIISLRRVAIGLWVSLIPLLAVMLLWPVSSRSRRLGIVMTFLGIVAGSLIIARKRRAMFWSLAALYSAIALFLFLPGRPPENISELQESYIKALAAYEGVPYVWGGETRFGMDCSGLVRKGFQNALLKTGIRTLNPSLIRGAIDLWWNDTTAAEIARGYGERTVRVRSCPSLNKLDPAALQPGDIAVTLSGIHVMAYLGSNKWIGADPGEMKVIVFPIPEAANGWFSCPMIIMRWNRIWAEGKAQRPTSF